MRFPLCNSACARTARLHAKKKSFTASERDTPEWAETRKRFCDLISSTPVDKLVFLDESGCKTGMRREYAYAPRGARAVAKRPGRTWRSTSLIGTIRLGQRPRLMTCRGAVNDQIFLKLILRRVIPILRAGDVVVMDNINFHKMEIVRDAISIVGAKAVYLPTYSPELNPIELWWGHLKRSLRALAVDTESALLRALAQLRTKASVSHIQGWFRFALKHVQFK